MITRIQNSSHENILQPLLEISHNDINENTQTSLENL